MNQFSKLDNYNFVDELDNPTIEFFKENYQDKNIPCIIKNSGYKLNKEITGEIFAAELGANEYIPYMNQSNPYTPEEVGVDIGNCKYLKAEVPEKLRHYYDVPKYFRDSKVQPQGWRWMYWGPGTTWTPLHKDVDNSHAWLYLVSGAKLWRYCYNDTVYTGVQKAGEISFTPGCLPHLAMNLETSFCVTHNYKEK